MSNINYNDCSYILNYPLDIKQKYAYKFAEGSESLYNLLLSLWKNNIYTLGCCIGHDTKESKNNSYFSYMLTGIEGSLLATYIIDLVNEYNDLGLKCYILGPHPKTGYLDFSFRFPKEHSDFIIGKVLNFLNNIDYSMENGSDIICAYKVLNSKLFKYFTIEIEGIDNKGITVIDNNMDTNKRKYILNEISEILVSETKTK